MLPEPTEPTRDFREDGARPPPSDRPAPATRWTFRTRHRLNGSRERPVRLGVQTLGRLNETRDNAVLVCHYYTGTMHVAGHVSDDPETPGWWETLIGPGRAVDTDRFFVVCMNSVSNVQALDPDVVTTGPDRAASADAGEGLDDEPFPAWRLADLWQVQCALLRELGLPRWYAVIGPSFGGMQALQWAARAPELAPRVAAVAASPYADVVLRDVFHPLLRAAAESGGLGDALRLITAFGLGAEGLHRAFEGGDLDAHLATRSRTASLAHVLDIGRAVTTHDLREVAPLEELARRWRTARLRLLTVNVRGDAFFPLAPTRALTEVTRRAGVPHTHIEFDSDLGHLACVEETWRFETALRLLMNAEEPGEEDGHAEV